MPTHQLRMSNSHLSLSLSYVQQLKNHTTMDQSGASNEQSANRSEALSLSLLFPTLAAVGGGFSVGVLGGWQSGQPSAKV